MESSYEAASAVLEGETCQSLVGLLGQLADLVDHSAVVFAGLHEQVRDLPVPQSACELAETLSYKGTISHRQRLLGWGRCLEDHVCTCICRSKMSAADAALLSNGARS